MRPHATRAAGGSRMPSPSRGRRASPAREKRCGHQGSGRTRTNSPAGTPSAGMTAIASAEARPRSMFRADRRKRLEPDGGPPDRQQRRRAGASFERPRRRFARQRWQGQAGERRGQEREQRGDCGERVARQPEQRPPSGSRASSAGEPGRIATPPKTVAAPHAFRASRNGSTPDRPARVSTSHQASRVASTSSAPLIPIPPSTPARRMRHRTHGFSTAVRSGAPGATRRSRPTRRSAALARQPFLASASSVGLLAYA